MRVCGSWVVVPAVERACVIEQGGAAFCDKDVIPVSGFVKEVNFQSRFAALPSGLWPSSGLIEAFAIAAILVACRAFTSKTQTTHDHARSVSLCAMRAKRS
jgi:hypothetical protein